MRVSEQGMNVRSSREGSGRGRSVPKPRRRERPSSALRGMSSITSGRQIWVGRSSCSEGGFPYVELLLVVVPELAPRDDLAEGVRTLQTVLLERAADLGELLRAGVGDDRVVAQLGDLAA